MTLDINNVCKTYKGFTNNKVLDHCSLNIKDKEICSIIGVNGAGKSTLIKSILALISIDSGTITYNNDKVSELMKDRKIGYMPESLGFPKGVSVENYLNDIAILKDMDKITRKEAIDELLYLFNLESHKKYNIGKLSKGMQKKVGFIQGVLNNPSLLILDEPTDGLDPEARRNMLNFIKNMALGGTTIIITSHILADLELISHRVAILKGGRIIKELPREEFLGKKASITLMFSDGKTEERVIDMSEGSINIDMGQRRALNKIYINTASKNLEDLYIEAIESQGEVKL